MNRYDAAYLCALPLIAPAVAYKRIRYGKYRESLPGMLGRRTPKKPLPPAAEQRCWIHSVSVGETVAAGSVYRDLKCRVPGWEFLVTTTTETGQAQARKTMGTADWFSYAPADFSWTVRHHLAAFRPTLYLFFETEIWPNVLGQSAALGLPVFMVNGKLSERSARRYAAAAFLFRPILSGVTRFFMQTSRDAERLERIVGDAKRIEVTGNVKFDALPDPLSAVERTELRSSWRVQDQDIVVLAGSTHAGEELLIWKAWSEARLAVPELRLIIAPRHPERFGEVKRLLKEAGASVHRMSAGSPAASDRPDVLLLDQMGVLARSFGGCEIALVAGSWNLIGGHNLLEAGVHGVPVLRGPHMHSQPDIVRVLGPENGALEVTGRDLGSAILQLSRDAEKRGELGRLAAAASNSMKGSAKRVVEGILNRTPARRLSGEHADH